MLVLKTGCLGDGSPEVLGPTVLVLMPRLTIVLVPRRSVLVWLQVVPVQLPVQTHVPSVWEQVP